MKISKKALEAASEELGYKIDKERARSAVGENEGLWFNLDVARNRLKDLEFCLDKLGGRGVELAEQIDDLRIYIAVCENPSVDQELQFTVTVKAPEDSNRVDVADLVDRLIRCGIEEAKDSPEDYEDPDAEIELVSVK